MHAIGCIAHQRNSFSRRMGGTLTHQWIAGAFTRSRKSAKAGTKAFCKTPDERFIVPGHRCIYAFGLINPDRAKTALGLGQKRQRATRCETLPCSFGWGLAGLNIEDHRRLAIIMMIRADAGNLAHHGVGAVRSDQQPGCAKGAVIESNTNPIPLDRERFQARRAELGDVVVLLQRSQHDVTKLSGHNHSPEKVAPVVCGAQVQATESSGARDPYLSDRHSDQRFREQSKRAEDIERGGVDDQSAVVVTGLVIGASLGRFNDRNAPAGACQPDSQSRTDQATASEHDIKVTHACMTCSIWSIVAGTARVSTSGSFAVTRTSSSMRIPILRSVC